MSYEKPPPKKSTLIYTLCEAKKKMRRNPPILLRTFKGIEKENKKTFSALLRYKHGTLVSLILFPLSLNPPFLTLLPYLYPTLTLKKNKQPQKQEKGKTFQLTHPSIPNAPRKLEKETKKERKKQKKNVPPTPTLFFFLSRKKNPPIVIPYLLSPTAVKKKKRSGEYKNEE